MPHADDFDAYIHLKQSILARAPLSNGRLFHTLAAAGGEVGDSPEIIKRRTAVRGFFNILGLGLLFHGNSGGNEQERDSE